MAPPAIPEHTGKSALIKQISKATIMAIQALAPK